MSQYLRIKSNEYLCRLMIIAESTSNKKEIELIDTLDDLLSQLQKGSSLSQYMLDKVVHKMSRVSSFSETYGDIVQFLQNYQSKLPLA